MKLVRMVLRTATIGYFLMIGFRVCRALGCYYALNNTSPFLSILTHVHSKMYTVSTVTEGYASLVNYRWTSMATNGSFSE